MGLRKLAAQGAFASLCVACALAFVPPNPLSIASPRRAASSVVWAGVDGLPSQVATQEALYDMILVERLPEEQKMASGLFLPTKTNPRMHVCKVLSIGGGREGENGTVIPNEGVGVGDLVYVKDPWGIGPRDDEFANRKFSYVRYTSICARVPDDDGSFEANARKAAAEAQSLNL